MCMIGWHSPVRLKCWWPTHSLFTSWPRSANSYQFLINCCWRKCICFIPRHQSWAAGDKHKTKNFILNTKTQSGNPQKIFIYPDGQTQKMGFTTIWTTWIEKHKVDIAQKFSTAVAFAICNQPNLLSMTCASLPLMGTSASSFGGFPMEKLVRGRAPLLLLFTPTSHSRGNWKKSKRLNLISGWEKQRERGKNAKKNPALENVYK